MLDVVTSFLQESVQSRIRHGADLKNARGSPSGVHLLTIFGFFFECQYGSADLFNAVGPVRVKIGKTQDPSVINFHLVGRPCVERQVFNLFYIRNHICIIAYENA